MIIDPPISEISKKADSRYTLVTMAAKRARMIGQNTETDGEVHEVKNPVSIAVHEIAEGIVGYTRSTDEAPAIDYWPKGHKEDDVIEDEIENAAEADEESSDESEEYGGDEEEASEG